MTTGSDPASGWPGPLYLDASALAKLYLPETGSADLDTALTGRRDIVVSDLCVTEIVSAVARRRREGAISPEAVARLHRRILSDVDAGLYRRVDLLPAVQREAERLLLIVEGTALRAADALHLALALASGAACVVTYDRRMAEAAPRVGLGAAAP